MAIIFLTNNYTGIGQTVRSVAISDAIPARFGKPTILAQGQGLEPFFCGYTGKCIPFFGSLPKKEQEQVAKYIEDFALISGPALLIEDTHPVEWSFSPSISRALVLCPPKFEHLEQMRKRCAGRIDAWLIADAPGSPTWPYDSDQTATLLNREDVELLGPVYRKPDAGEIKSACRLISHHPDRPVCLFTMGCSEQHLSSDYVEGFSQVAALIRARLRDIMPDIRCIFVKEPLINSSAPLPPGFEVLEQVDCLPALIEISFAAVIRPGFNTVWECINGRTPFFAIEEERANPSVPGYVANLRRQGLYSDAPLRDWQDRSFLSEFKRKCAAVTADFTGLPRFFAFEKLLGPQLPSKRRSIHIERGKSGKGSSKRVLFVAENGIGIGHIVRSIRIAQEMQRLGHDVHLVFESSVTWADDVIPIPFTLIPKAFSSHDVKAHYFTRLEEILDDFDPHAVVFDRHVIDNSSLADMLALRCRYRAALSSVPSVDLLAAILERKDVDQTIFLHSKKDFRMMYGSQAYRIVAESDSVAFAGGPIYPGAAAPRHKEALKVPQKPFVVFINGGGGEHYGKQDTEIIARVVNHAAKKLRKHHGLGTVFIGGPNFKHRHLVDRRSIRYASYTPNTIELMKAARLTVLRPGFNLAREAYDSARAIVALQTFQYQEATDQHLSLLRNHPAFRAAALDCEGVYQAIETLLSRENSARPPALWQDGLPRVVDLLTGRQVDEKPLRCALEELGSMHCEKRLVIRIDDVVRLDEPLDWLLTTLAERKLCASLEIVPYHADIRESDLAAYDPSQQLFEAAQHGWCHLSIQPAGVPAGEFPYDIEKYTRADAVIRSIRKGRDRTAERFPTTFSGGFSPPYDSCPGWLPILWAELGGTFVSTIFTSLLRSPIPVVRLGADVWDWRKDRLRSHAGIFSYLIARFLRRGRAGLVFHPQKLMNPDDRQAVEQLLDTMIAAGITPIKLSDWAVNNARHTATSESRRMSDAQVLR